MANVSIYPDAEFLARAAADHFIEIAEQAVRERGLFSVAFSGGNTPLMLYHLLATEPFSERVDWSRTHIFWGDERCVPPDHADSNYFRASQALLERVPIPPENIHRIPAELPPDEAALAYEETLLRFFEPQAGQSGENEGGFDLALLGMGDDGHTASLFPGTPAIEEQARWVMAQYVDKLAAWRITLTPALLNRSRRVIFLVAGPGKSYTLQRVVYGTYFPDRYPAQIVRPASGEVLWLVDEAAAALF